MKRTRTSDTAQWWNIAEIHYRHRNSKIIPFSWREKEDRTLVNHEILLKFIIMREIPTWSHFDEAKKNIAHWSMMKYSWNSSSWEKFSNDHIFMRRKSTSDAGQRWNIVEIHHDQRNFKMISFWSREKEHRTLGNHQILLKFTIFTELLKLSHFDEAKKNIGPWWMMKYCWNSLSWENFSNDLISMTRKNTSDAGQWWNIVEIHHRKRNSETNSFWWREKQYRTFVNDEILLKFIIVRKILKWSYFDEEKNNIVRSSMMKYCWNSSSSEKF